jgi:hypothetical protein
MVLIRVLIAYNQNMASSDEEVFLGIPTSKKAVRPQIQVTVSRPTSIQETSNERQEKQSLFQPRPSESATTFGSKLTAASARTIRSNGSLCQKTPHTDRIKGLMNAFITRARRRQLRSPESRTLTPESSSIANVSAITGATAAMRQRLESYIGLEKRVDSEDESMNCLGKVKKSVTAGLSAAKKSMSPIDPLGSLYFVWLAVLSVTFLYNAVAIFMRAAFSNLLHTSQALPIWLTVDYICDAIYLIDIVAIRIRLGYLEEGIIQEDTEKIRRQYVKSIGFVVCNLYVFVLCVCVCVSISFIVFNIFLCSLMCYHFFLWI